MTGAILKPKVQILKQARGHAPDQISAELLHELSSTVLIGDYVEVRVGLKQAPVDTAVYEFYEGLLEAQATIGEHLRFVDYLGVMSKIKFRDGPQYFQAARSVSANAARLELPFGEETADNGPGRILHLREPIAADYYCANDIIV